MDPNVALENARRAVRAINGAIDRDEEPQFGNVERLVEYFAALDEWLSRGGFLPAAWER